MGERIGFGFYQSCSNMGIVGRLPVKVAVVWAVAWPGRVGWCCLCCEMRCPDICVLHCARRIPAHLWCTQCSILLHLIDICFLTCICMWQISQIQTLLGVVVGPGFVSTSPAFMRSSASHPGGDS